MQKNSPRRTLRLCAVDAAPPLLIQSSQCNNKENNRTAVVGQKLIDTLWWLIYRIAPPRCHCNILSLKPRRVWLVRGLCSLWAANGPALVHTAVVGVGLKVVSQSSRFQLVYVRGNLEQAEAQIKYSRSSYQPCVACFRGGHDLFWIAQDGLFSK